VDLERFHPEAVNDERLRLLMTYWGLPQQREHTKSEDERPLRFLLPARLTPWKGHDLALQAFREWRRRGGGAFELVFAGAGEGGDSFPEDLAARIEAYGLSREVRMVGHVQDAPAAYAWADVVLAPSVRPEAFGRTSVEAQAAQKPVLAANHGGARETVLHGKTGFLLEPGDVTAWASALEHMARLSPQERAAMGKAGRENAENFSLQAMCRRTLSVYEEVAREKGRLG
jgi:glycosyltransferase involved in cell wall biosynthesis